MRKNRNLVAIAFAIVAFCAGLLVDGNIVRVWPCGSFTTEADAAVVIRRTKHHHYTVRRSTIYISVLPAGCVKVSINGVRYWHCGAKYYQHYDGRYVVVYIK